MSIRLGREAGAGVVEQVVLGITFFLIYGILLREVGAELVGIFSLVLVLSSIGLLANVGFGSALLRFVPMYEGRGERQVTVRFVENAVVCAGLLYICLMAIIFIPFRWFIEGQVGPNYSVAVRKMMVPAAIHVVAMGVGAVTTAALSAVHRADLRAISNCGGAAICLVVIIAGTDALGVAAAFWGLTAQSIFVLMTTWLFLKRALPELRLLPRDLHKATILELVRFGFKLQLQSLLLLALEPATRLLVGQFGTLSQVTYFSMAARLVMQIRSVIYFSAQPVLAAFGFLRENDPERMRALYATFCQRMGLVSILMLSATAAAAPFIGEIWIGTAEPFFVTSVALQAVGWLALTIILGPYFNAYSQGYLRYNVGSHMVMAIANLILGPICGFAFGALGVVLAMSASLVIGGAIIGIGNAHLPPQAPAFDVKAEGLLFIVAMAAVAAAFIAYGWLRADHGPFASAAIAALVWLIPIGPAVWFHPCRRPVVEWIRTLRGGTDRDDTVDY